MNPRYRHKIRIGPSGVVYVVLALLILGTGVHTQNNLLFWAFGLMVGGLLVSIALSWLSIRGLRIERLLPDHAVVGQPLVLRYIITNPKSLVPVFNLVVMENWGRGSRGYRRQGPVAEHPKRLGGPPHGWVLHLGPRQNVQAEAICWPLRRGLLHLDRIVMSTTFPFGLLRQILEVQQPGQVLVYPRLHRLNKSLWFRLAAADPGGYLQIDQGGGTEEFFGLRRYRPGDSMRTVDWRHTARTGELISRELTIPCPPRVMLALDLRHLSEEMASPGGGPNPTGQPWDLDDPWERAISLAASVICGAHSQGYQIGMAILGPPALLFRIHHSLPHRNHMLEALALVDIRSEAHSPRILPSEPTVLIRVGQGPMPQSRSMRVGGRCLIMDARVWDQYVHPSESHVEQLLSRVVTVRSRKQRRMLGEAWT